MYKTKFSCNLLTFQAENEEKALEVLYDYKIDLLIVNEWTRSEN